MRWKWVFIVPAAILGIIVFVALGGLIVQSLWNWLLPDLFGWRQIGFWQALGLLLLCRILFGGFGSHGSGRSRMGRRMGERWNQRLAERWERLSPEERERFRQGLHGACGFAPPADEPGSEAKGQ